MKSIERHRLKEDEFARSVAAARETLAERGNDIMRFAIIAVLLIVAIAGYTMWRTSRNAKADAALASGLAIFEAPVIPPAAPAPGSPIPVQQPGTYQTEQAKLEAALPKLMEAADAFPNAPAGVAATVTARAAVARIVRRLDEIAMMHSVPGQACHGLEQARCLNPSRLEFPGWPRGVTASGAYWIQTRTR